MPLDKLDMGAYILAYSVPRVIPDRYYLAATATLLNSMYIFHKQTPVYFKSTRRSYPVFLDSKSSRPIPILSAMVVI